VLVVDRLPAQDQQRDVDHREHTQQQQRRGPAEQGDVGGAALGGVGADDVDDQAEGDERREDDRDPRRTPRGVHLAEDARQHVLVGQSVEQPAGHQHVDERGVGHGEQADEREDLVEGQVRCSGRHDLGERLALLGSVRSPTGTNATAVIETTM
jgi:hypothetical protein